MGGLASVLELPGTRCAGCGAPGDVLCGPCARSLVVPRRQLTVSGVRAIAAAFNYSGAARRLVLGLKLGGNVACAAPLIEGMATASRSLGCGAPVVTWVPARRRDLATRGIDHARVLARGVGSRLGLEVRPLLTRSRRRVADQAGLGAAERVRNLDGAFLPLAYATSVLLVDDLVTTGATAAAGARALELGGTTDIWALAACSARG